MPADKKNNNEKLLDHGVQLSADPGGSSVQLYSISHYDKAFIDRVQKANQERVDAYKKYPPGTGLDKDRDKELADIEKRLAKSLRLKDDGFTKKGFLTAMGDQVFQAVVADHFTPFSDWSDPSEKQKAERTQHVKPAPAMFAAANEGGHYNRPNQPHAQFHPQATAFSTPSQWQPSMGGSQSPYFPPPEQEQHHAQLQVPEEDVRLNFWAARLATAGYNPVPEPNGSMSFYEKDARKGDPPVANVERDTGRISIDQNAGQDAYDNVMETLKAGGGKGITILGNPSLETVDMIQRAAQRNGLEVKFANPNLEMTWNQAQAQRMAAMAQPAPLHSIAPSAWSSVAPSTQRSQSSSYNPSTSSTTATSTSWSQLPSRKPAVSRPASPSNVLDLSQVNAKLNEHLKNTGQQKPASTNSGQSFMDWLEKNKHTYTKDEQGNYRHKDKPDTVAFSIKSANEGSVHLELPSKNSPIIDDLGKMAITKGDVKVTTAHKEDAHELWKQAALKGRPLTVDGFTRTPEQTQNLGHDLLHNHPPTYESQKGQFTQALTAAKEGDAIPKGSKMLCRLDGVNGGAIVAVPPAKTDGRPITDHNKKTWELKELSASQLKVMNLDDKRQGYVLPESQMVGRSQEEFKKMVADQTKAQAQSASLANTTGPKGYKRH